MNLTDINGKSGPYWRAYQVTRQRDHITDNPDYVPYWFLEKLARARIAAARVAMEQLGGPEDLWHSLRNLEISLGAGSGLDEREVIVLGILGADEAANTWVSPAVEADARWFDGLFAQAEDDRPIKLVLAAVRQIRETHNWAERISEVIRLWGGVVPPAGGSLVFTKALAEAWLKQREPVEV